MAYISLYRKYRPQTFADTDLVGQGHITHTLQHAIAAGRVAHAYLFCGPRGTGKTSTARLLAKALNCDRGPTAEPCDRCPACEAIKNGSALDVIEIDAASNRGIDQIRDLRDRVAFAPAEGRYKVYIIDEVHMLTNESFNALLKTLEEPPAHVVFVMATTEAHRLPPTILSRCQRFDFHRIPAADMLARLQLICQAEGIEADEQALSLLVRAAEGCMRDALSLLEQAYAYATGAIGPDEVHAVLGGVDTGLLLDFGRVISQRDAAAAFRLVEQTVSQGKDVRAVVGELVDHFRNLLLLATVRDGDGLVALPPAAIKQLAAQAAEIPPETLLRALETFSEAERELRWSTQQRLVLELALVKLCRPAPAPAAAAQPAVTAARPAARRPAPSPVGQEPAVGQELAPAPAQEPAPAPPQEPAAAPAQAAAPPADGDPLAQVKEHWPAILMRFRKTGRVQISAFLTEAEPVAVSGNALQLHFRQPFHCDAMSKRTAELEEVLREFGLSLTVKCAMAPGLAGQAAPGKPSVIARNVMGVFPGSTEIEG